MATTFHFKEPSKTEINIELSFGISITQVRGLNPPNPKEIFTRDWASEDGVDYYVPTTRKVKSSEVVIQFYAVDDSTSTAIYKYNDFCNYLLTVENPLRYRDTLQNQQVNLLYDSNKPAWYQLYSSTNKKLVAEVTLINPTGAATYVGGDTIIPIITLTDGAVTLDFGEAYVDPGYSADDNVDGDITANVVVAGDTVDENTAGVYVITYNVSDAAGNAAVEKTRTVTVSESVIPIIETVSATLITSGGATLTLDVISLGSGAPLTETGFEWGITDGFGNTSSASGKPLGEYSKLVGGMPSETLIYYRGYSINSGGTGYGETLTFTTLA